MRLTSFEHPEKVYCRIEYKTSSVEIDPEKIGAVFASLQDPVVMGGNNADQQDNRFWYFAANPLHTYEFNQSAGFEDWLDNVLGRFDLAENENPDLPAEMFKGGWAGFFSYDLCRQFESIPQSNPADPPTPLARLAFYDRLIAYDRSDKTVYLIALALGPADDTSAKFDRLLGYINQSNQIDLPSIPASDIEQVDFSDVRSNMSNSEYVDAIRKTKEYIKNGDVYQINYSQRFEIDYPGFDTRSFELTSEFTAAPEYRSREYPAVYPSFSSPAYDLYRWQNRFNPSPYSAYLGTDRYKIVCASPELFLSIRGDEIYTCPIKGTKPRIPEDSVRASQTNQANIQQLLDCEKEKAELNMIIDLERNDLGRICIPGTRHVSKPRHIREYPSVYHAVAEVRGLLQEDIGLCGVLKSTFPGGSITGAPKIRAMEIIDELEPCQRGIYTGSIGFIGIDGSVCLNIVIRTVIILPNVAYVQTGGGIVADSDPQKEWQETITKARALIAGLNVVAAV